METFYLRVRSSPARGLTPNSSNGRTSGQLAKFTVLIGKSDWEPGLRGRKAPSD